MDGDEWESSSQVDTVNDSNVSEKSPKEPISKIRIIKNLIVICFGFLLLFIAYNGLSALQSTMNQEHGIGVASQGIIYAAFCISSFVLPKYVIKKLGCKYTLVVSMTCYIPYIAANFYFNWITMVPSAALLGIAASLLWTSQSTYFNKLSVLYSILCAASDDSEKVVKDNLNNVLKVDYTTECTNASYFIEDTEQNRLNYEACDSISMLVKPISVMLENDLAISYSGGKGNRDSLGSNARSKANYDISSKQNNHLEINNFTSADIKYNGKNGETTMGKIYKTGGVPVIIQPETNSKIVSSVTSRFFGIFGLVCRTSDVWGNLMSYYILQDGSILDDITGNSNCSCGASFCNIESNCFEHNLAEPSQQMRNILTGVSVLIAVFAVILVFLFLEELEKDKEQTKFSFSLVMATCMFITEKKALFILPLTSYNGFIQGFYIADFTKSFIACAWGVYHVGLVTIAFGLASGISSIVSGFLVKYVGRVPVVMSAALINAAIHIFLLVWTPLPDHPLLFFVAATSLGLSVGIMWTQLRAFYGIAFKKDEEAAFAGFYLWSSIGYIISFSYSNYICTYIKIYILLVVSTVGIFGYLKAEFMHERQKRSEVL